jgi:hypothetical protein
MPHGQPHVVTLFGQLDVLAVGQAVVLLFPAIPQRGLAFGYLTDHADRTDLRMLSHDVPPDRSSADGGHMSGPAAESVQVSALRGSPNGEYL